MSIRENLLKIKYIITEHSFELYVVTAIILVGLSGFGLGRLSAVEERVRPEVTILGPTEHPKSLLGTQHTPVGASIGVAGELVGSVSGSRYHYPWCPGAQQILEHNKVWFSSQEEARAAGYTPAQNCEGL